MICQEQVTAAILELMGEGPFNKPEFQPLLPAGLHPMELSEVHALCVTPFALSTTRPMIWEGLETVIATLRSHGVYGDLWLDGSFLTNKIDAKDVDLVLRAEAELVENGSDEAKAAVAWFMGNLKDTHLCDSYVFFVWPEGHPHHPVGLQNRAYWLGQFGFDRKDQPKGLALVKL